MIRKDAINILKGIQQENLEEKDFLGKCAIDMAIKALKEQRPHGKWEACEDTSFCKCSKCGEVVMLEETYIFLFCPHCGADMRPKEGAENERI